VIELTVDFGFLTFLHEADYWERSERGDLPAGLTLLMAANTLRYVFFTTARSRARPRICLIFSSHPYYNMTRVSNPWQVEFPTSSDFAPISSVPSVRR
jgi:hypothetical protein